MSFDNAIAKPLRKMSRHRKIFRGRGKRIHVDVNSRIPRETNSRKLETSGLILRSELFCAIGHDCSMDSMNQIKTIQDMDKESGQVSSDCLSIPIILREIFQCFATKELIQLSLVSKQWNYEARSLMRIRGNLSASINKNHTCQDLRAFALDLRRMRQMKKVVPFSGMTITIGGSKCNNRDHCQQSPKLELEPVYEEILGSLTWKHLSVRHLVGWHEHTSCPAFMLQKKVFRKLDSALEELSLQLESNEANYFKQVFLRDCYFSRLKTFNFLNGEESLEPEWADLIKTVVSHAPTLQILYTKECVDLNANLMEGSLAVHVAGSAYSPSDNEIPESVAGVIRMHGIDFVDFSPDFSLQKFSKITSVLLQSSRIIMSSINIDVIFLAALIKYGTCMDKVTKFELAMVPLDSEEIPPHIWRIAKSFDFTRMFPNLKTVNIVTTTPSSIIIPEEFNEMIEEVNATLGAPSPDRVDNIKTLQLDFPSSHGRLSRRSSFHLIAQIFPHAQKLSIRTDEVPSADIRDVWADLKEVAILLDWSLDLLTNLDSVVCGIFPEEVAQLREQDEEYLRRVNIVPVMPSIAYWKELRGFRMDYEKCGDPYTGPTDDATCVFSRVTGLIAFQRCPNLTVALTSDDERLVEALGHLKPFAALIFKSNRD